MNTYRHTTTGEVREISDELIAAWEAAGNPKRQEWEAYTPPAPEPPQPEPQYLAFWDAVLISSTYATLLGAAMSSLPVNTALTAFIAAFQDAKEGRPNAGAIQACIFLIMGAAQSVLTAEHLVELQGLMDAHNLSGVYTLTPP